MSEVEVIPLHLRRSKTVELMKRFSKLPKWQQELIREDMECAFENRITVMERINNKTRKN